MGAKGKKQQGEAPVSGIVIGYNKRRFLNRRLSLLLLGGLIIIAAIAAGTALVISKMSKPSTPKSSEQIPKTNEQLSGTALTSQINAYLAQKSYNAAIYILQAQKDQSYNTKSLLGSVYMAAGKYQDALNVYDALAKDGDGTAKLSQSDNAAAAQAAVQVGQYQKAIAYYQKAIDQAKAIKTGNLQQASNQVTQYQQAIQDAQQKL